MFPLNVLPIFFKRVEQKEDAAPGRVFRERNWRKKTLDVTIQVFSQLAKLFWAKRFKASLPFNRFARSSFAFNRGLNSYLLTSNAAVIGEPEKR